MAQARDGQTDRLTDPPRYGDIDCNSRHLLQSVRPTTDLGPRLLLFLYLEQLPLSS